MCRRRRQDGLPFRAPRAAPNSTIRSVVEEVLGSEIRGKVDCIVQGVILDGQQLDATIAELWTAARHMDRFVYILTKKREII